MSTARIDTDRFNTTNRTSTTNMTNKLEEKHDLSNCQSVSSFPRKLSTCKGDETLTPSSTQIKVNRLRSNTLFAYREDDFFMNHPWFDSEDDTHFIPKTDLSSSNLFSFCDKSLIYRIDDMNECRNEDENDCSISSDMAKNILNDIIDDKDDPDYDNDINELNKAKLSVHNADDSLNIDEENNLSTPLNYRSTALEPEEFIFKNHNQPHNFSSSSLSCFNMTNFNNQITNYQNFTKNILTPTSNQNYQEKANITSDAHTLSLTEYSNSSYSYGIGNYNSGYFNNQTMNNQAMLSDQHSCYPNRKIMNNHMMYQANSFCFDPNYNFNPNNPNNYTYNEMVNRTINVNPCRISNPGMQSVHINSNTYLEEKYILDNATNYAKDNNGCRIVQKKFEEKRGNFANLFFESIQDNLFEIINHQSGNYVCQKMLEFSSTQTISKFLEKVKYQLKALSMNQYGTRTFQKLLDYITLDKDFDILKEFLSGNILSLILDQNGNHVIQKILFIFPKHKNQFIFDELTKHILEISRIQKGGIIISKALSIASEQQKYKLITEITKYVDKLISDAYGNFIIQSVFLLKLDEFNKKIFMYVRDNIVQLSKNKFSSHVIDKCILKENTKFRTDLIDKIVDGKHIAELICDEYGNYVVQVIMAIVKDLHENRFLTIVAMVKNAAKTLLQSDHGRKIYDKLTVDYPSHFKCTKKNKAVKKNSEKPEK